MDGLVKLCMRATGQLSKVPQKKAACDLIAALGNNLRLAAEHVVPVYQGEIMKCLEQAASEK